MFENRHLYACTCPTRSEYIFVFVLRDLLKDINKGLKHLKPELIQELRKRRNQNEGIMT